jgi:acyl phosphate:glycerol-3-phosphate acyltransferase
VFRPGAISMNGVIAIVAAYLLGSIPFAQLLSQRYGVDLREAGSGNVGATNVLRTVGVGMAIGAVLLDAAKGTVAVLIAQRIASSVSLPAAAAVAAVVGHVYPVWLRFQGGKGVATAAGAFGVLTPAGLGAAMLVFAAAVSLTRFVSVGSILGALTLTGVAWASGSGSIVGIGAAVATLVIVYGHRGNLARLIAGTEQRLGRLGRAL